VSVSVPWIFQIKTERGCEVKYEAVVAGGRTQLTATVAYRYLQTSTDVALTSGDPTVTAPGYLYAGGGEQVKPTNPPTTFDELQERMEALDELANMTEQESRPTCHNLLSTGH